VSTASWLDELVAHGFDDPAGVIEDITATEVEVGGEAAGRLTLTLRVRDMRNDPYVAQADVYLPKAHAGRPAHRLPVWFGCHYEVELPTVARHLQRGRAVFSPRKPAEPPSVAVTLRSHNHDYVLAHLARGARFVDPAAIVYGGGSAGGAAALMVAAEAFPASAAMATAPPVNLGYETAYVATVYPRFVADPPADHPVIAMITAGFAMAVAPWSEVYGDVGGQPAFDHSVVAHVDRITGLVFVMTSTADFLVPVEQFSRELAQATLADPPQHVTIAAEELDPSHLVAVRLVDVLGDRADVRRLPLPHEAQVQQGFDQTMQAPRLLVDVPDTPAEGRQWLVTFLDEGPIVLGATHGLHAVEADTEPFLKKALSRGIGADQLTPAKLAQLLDRYAGVEWLAEGYHHLDEPAAEQADVLRGLRLYCQQSPDHAQRFEELYAAVDSRRRILPAL
jgi:hypothetical protein